MVTIENTLNYAPSCTLEDAVLYLLGFPQKYVQAHWIQHSEDPTDGEWIPNDGYNLLEDTLELAKSDYAEAKHDNASDEIIAIKLAEIDRCIKQTKLAHSYSCSLVNEIAKGTNSLLLIDSIATKNHSNPYITLLSLKHWAVKNLNLSILDDLPSTLSSQAKSKKDVTDDESPWLVPNPNDPEPEQPWYTVARYFARQVLKDFPQHSTNKAQLANKVAPLLKDAKFKPPGKLAYDAGTIRKAFAKVKF